MEAQHYKQLVVWQKGMLLAQKVYQLTRQFPPDERFGLIAQMRRAAVSVPSNIAEGQARRTTGEFLQFISQAEGSLAELDTQALLSVQLGFCKTTDTTEVSGLITELQKMLTALRRKLSASH
jgi:four helix bundle protein